MVRDKFPMNAKQVGAFDLKNWSVSVSIGIQAVLATTANSREELYRHHSDKALDDGWDAPLPLPAGTHVSKKLLAKKTPALIV